MVNAVRRIAEAMNPVRARAKVLARENRQMRSALIRVRREAGLSQQDVADRLGITQQAVQKMERYDADLKLSTLERYANAVGALVMHRVVVDRGQSVRLAYQSPWLSQQVVSGHHIVSIRERSVGRVDDWLRAPERISEAINR
jgi:transcriptional regulator with XRE-family HTH domain